MTDDEHHTAHGLCLDKECAYSGDMEWYTIEGIQFAVCPQCDTEWEWDAMPATAEERMKLLGF